MYQFQQLLNLRDTIKKFKELKIKKYLVAWMDTINTKNFGRSIIIFKYTF